MDTLRLPIRLMVHSTAVQDRDGAALLLGKVRRRFPWLECVFADGDYHAQQTYEAAAANHPLRLEVVRRSTPGLASRCQTALGGGAHLLLFSRTAGSPRATRTPPLSCPTPRGLARLMAARPLPRVGGALTSPFPIEDEPQE